MGHGRHKQDKLYDEDRESKYDVPRSKLGKSLVLSVSPGTVVKNVRYLPVDNDQGDRRTGHGWKGEAFWIEHQCQLRPGNK